jgi:hypothetical protein
MNYNSNNLNTQNELLMKNLMVFYGENINGVDGVDDKYQNLSKMINIINGESKISLRIIDWFVTNFSKKHFIIYDVTKNDSSYNVSRFKVYNDYKLKLKAYSKKNFDPFCRWTRVTIPYDNDKFIETTIGQLNFFKWAIEHNIIEYIHENYSVIEFDMNQRNSTSKKRAAIDIELDGDNSKTRKKRVELSVSAVKCIKKENVKIIVKFS